MTSGDDFCLINNANVSGTGFRRGCGSVMSPQQALDDAHIQASRFFTGIGFPGIDVTVPVAEAPFKLTETPAEISRRAPLLGEHTESILTDLGYSKARISALRDRGVI